MHDMMLFQHNHLHHPPIIGLKDDHPDLSTFINKQDVDHDHDMINGDLQMESIFDIVGRDVPKMNDSTTEKLCWLRSQIISGTAQFETPFGLRRLTYADHTASGRSLHHVEDYIATKVLPFYGNSHTSDSHVGYETTKMVHEATNYVKKCLGGGDKDEEEDGVIIFCGSGSTAAIKRLQEVMGIAVPSILRERMLKCMGMEERWVVLVGPYEHHSNILSWRESLAEVVEIGLDHLGQIDMEELRRKLSFYKLKKPRPILGSFSACSNVTGIITDTRAVARLLHQYGAFACFDFAASGPYAKVEMRWGEADGYDAVFVSPHKFVGGPGTPGILLMSKALYRIGSSPPSTSGGGTVHYVNNFDQKDTIYLDDIEEREDAGTPQIIQKIRAALAFSIKEYIGYDAIEKVEKRYIDRAMQRFVLNPNISILGNPNLKRQAILSFLVYPSSSSPLNNDSTSRGGKPLNGSFVAKLLNDLFGIQARGGCACAGPYGHSLLNLDRHHSLAIRSLIQKGYVGMKAGWTRVSFPYYMSEEELEFILEAIEFIGVYGERFMWCYNFSWTKGCWTFNKDIIKDHQYAGSYIAAMVKAFEIERNQKQPNIKQDHGHDDVLLRSYTNYLETAKQIATLLPNFPPHIKIPQEIDVDLVHFRI